MDNPKKIWKGIMVSENNNNKFYLMEWDGTSSTIQCTYGRVELTSTTISKPLSDWDKIIREKEKKGYKDVTHTVAETVVEKSDTDKPLAKIENSRIHSFITLMQGYTSGLVAKTYSVKAKSVTQAQLDDAQKIINDLTVIDRNDEKAVNKKLIDLYTIIPRYMRDVRVHLLPSIDFNTTFLQEQDNLDAMASQVKLAALEKPEIIVEQKSLLDIMGVTMDFMDGGIPDEIKYITDGIKREGRTIQSIFKAHKAEEETRFRTRMDKRASKDTKILIHGTSPTSVIPILNSRLMIRPTGNFSFAGKAFGNANYFASEAVKSLNYTGYQSDKVFLIYEVHLGNCYKHTGRNTYHGGSYFDKLVKDNDYDSVHAMKGKGSGDYYGLINDEYMVYTEDQNSLRYVIHMK